MPSKIAPLPLEDIPGDLGFQPGQRYDRRHLHEVYGGQWQGGISTPAHFPVIFIFTGGDGEKFGYEDRFFDDGTFLYTGEGQEGDMVWNRGNTAIRDHLDNHEELHLFENTDQAWIVTYVGQFQFVDSRETELPDVHGNLRRGIQFELEPVGGKEVKLEEVTSRNRLSPEKLFSRAKQSSPIEAAPAPKSSKTKRYSRSKEVKVFALRSADGVCQGCQDDAPFVDTKGRPFLEVHHLYRRSDGGPDDPENVIALCPNCHRRVHHGQEGKAFNEKLIKLAEDRNERLMN